MKRNRGNSVLTIHYHRFGSLQPDSREIRQFFCFFYVTKRKNEVTLTQKRKDAEQKRTAEAPGQKIKKGISEKTSRAVHPPGIRRIRKTFPPENVPRPPCRRIPMQTSADRLSCPGSPRFRDLPRQDRLCRRKDRSLLAVYYTTVQEAKQTYKPAMKRKKRGPDALFSRWSNLLVKFRGAKPVFLKHADVETSGHGTRLRENSGKREPHPGRTTDAAGIALSSARNVRMETSDQAHFGIRNSGIGICISSYMFIYCAKSR